jgi:pilus assembly protein CpaE
MADDMRDKFAKAAPQKPGWDSVETVIRDDRQQNPDESADAAPPLRVVPFGGNLELGTIPTTILDPAHHGSPRDPGDDPPARREAPRQPPPPARYSRAADHSYDAPLPQHKGKIIVMFGCRGGAGATMLAVNVGAGLARAGKSVCVVDFDLQLGDVFVALDLEASTSISGLARDAGNLDTAALRRRMVRHDSGLYCLSQTGRLDDVDPDLSERMPALLEMLQEHFDYVIIDGVRDFGDHALAALDAADKIALVLTQDVQAVRRAARVSQVFRRLGYPDKKIHLVLNRHTGKAHVDEHEIERVLAMPVSATIRNDYPRMQKALDEGSLLHDVARGTGVARDVERAARSLLVDPQRRQRDPEDDLDEKPGFFARLFGRR